MSWHRTDGWKDGDLPQSHRPLVLEEHSTNATQQRYSGGWIRITDSVIADPLEEPMRTTRPLTFTHEGKTWTWHRPGDPMPCDKEARIHYLDTNESCYGPEKASELFDDFGKNYPWPIIGWRYAEIETKTVPLGPEDVPPGSVFRSKDQPDTAFWAVAQVWTGGFYLRGENVDWPLAMERMEINRPKHRDADGNPTLWEPCHKQSTV